MKQSDTKKSWDNILKKGKYSLNDPDPWVIEKLKEFRKTDGGAYLDLGCGLGRHLEPMISIPGMSLGLDCSASAVKVTCNRTQGSPVIQGSMTDLPFKNNSFGTILAWRAIYLLKIEQIERAINEVYRVLQPGGRLLCSIRSTTNTLYYVGQEKGHQIEPGTFYYPNDEFQGAVYHFFSKDEIQERFHSFEIHDLHCRELAHTAFTVDRPEHTNDFWIFWATKR